MAVATDKAVRWTLERAAVEFEIDRKTLSKRVQSSSILPGKDRKFSTAQICSAVFGDIDGEKLLLVRAQRLKLESETAEREGRLTRTDNAARVLEEIVVSLRQTIVHAPELSDVVRSKLIQSLELDIHNAILRTETSEDAAPAGAADSAA